MSATTTTPTYTNKERLTRSQKEANDFQWYKDKANHFAEHQYGFASYGYGGVSEYKRMRVNYELFNNNIDLADFSYVCTPFGANVGELPARMVNRDISSYRIKALLGMELKRPFGYRCMATNREATTRKEEFETDQIRQYVISQIMGPIEQETELKYQEQLKGKLTPQEKQKIREQIAAEVKTKTPPQVRQYMLRDHQDPAEVQGQQLTNYMLKRQDIRKKFNLGWKHALLSAYEIYWMGIIKGEPRLKVVNPIRFYCDKSSDMQFIEDGNWAIAEYRMSPAEVAQTFDLEDTELDNVFKSSDNYLNQTFEQAFFDWSKSEEEIYRDYGEDKNTISVKHIVFKGLRRMGWLDYIDKDGKLQTKMMVDEDYKLNKDNGDVKLTWEWIPEVYEVYKIGADIYKNCQPVVGQFRDMDNIYLSKLPYYGAIYDNLNSNPTSPMDRMKVYQYYYNIVMYRLELLIASDKGKKLLMNINAVPADSGIDIKKWQYFFESSPFAWYNPDEEGMNQSDVNTVAKVLDMSLASDINRYIELAEYLEQKCGKSIGVTDPVLGQTAVSERVTNNQQNLVQTSMILEPYFDLHSCIKRNVMQGMLDLAKVAYADSDKKMLSYVMDDMSMQMFEVDANMLNSSTLGLFMEDSSMSEEIKQTITQLAHAAMQNQKIELSDVLKVIRQDSIQEAEEALLSAEEVRVEKEQDIQKKQNEFESEEAQKVRDHEEQKHEWDKELITLKEEERRETEIQKQAIFSTGFDPNKDEDNDGTPDVLEIARDGVNARIQLSKEARENRKLDHQIENDKTKNKIEEKKIASKTIK